MLSHGLLHFQPGGLRREPFPTHFLSLSTRLAFLELFDPAVQGCVFGHSAGYFGLWMSLHFVTCPRLLIPMEGLATGADQCKHAAAPLPTAAVPNDCSLKTTF